jgi:hypothetical protein
VTSKSSEERSSAAKADDDFVLLTARLKSCHFKAMCFSVSCKARLVWGGCGRTAAMFWYKTYAELGCAAASNGKD